MKLLVMESNERLGGQLYSAFERDGHDVTLVQTHTAALRRYELERPDFIVVDLMLPLASGFDFLQSVRGQSDTPIIASSASDRGSDRVRALDLGADDYISKPFWLDELMARMRAVSRRLSRHSQLDREYHFGTVKIDILARQAHVEGDIRPLTPTEFSLIELFMRWPHQALRRERIIDCIFRNPDSASEALQTHISRLRKKLGHEGQRIQTVWGIGYRFDPTPGTFDLGADEPVQLHGA